MDSVKLGNSAIDTIDFHCIVSRQNIDFEIPCSLSYFKALNCSETNNYSMGQKMHLFWAKKTLRSFKLKTKQTKLNSKEGAACKSQNPNPKLKL